MQRLYLLFFFLSPMLLQAQDITGIWQGHFRSLGSRGEHTSTTDDRYRFEVQIAQRGKEFEGVTYSYLSTLFYGKAAAKGTVNIHTQKVLLQEGKLLEFRNDFGDICIMTCFLQYSKSGGEEFLEGSYVSMNIRDSSNCGKGTVFLRKVQTSEFYPEPFLVKRQQEIEDSLKIAKVVHKPATTTATAAGKPAPKPATTTTAAAAKPANPSTAGTTTKPIHHPVAKPATTPPVNNPPRVARVTMPTLAARTGDSTRGDIGGKFPTIIPGVIKDRENEVIKTLVIHTTDITLNIYDDGAIDHDTVSVYLDNKPVLLHRMLTDRPLVVTVHLDESNDYHEVVMVADNEGEIPPNTSLMIVKAGDKEYEVRITTTEQKNAVIKFKYAK
jgi:riboflavin synthase